MNNFNDEGKEFIQSIYSKGNCFGEPPLFIQKTLSCKCSGYNDSKILAFAKEDFF